jgi:hypothetical protein
MSDFVTALERRRTGEERAQALDAAVPAAGSAMRVEVDVIESVRLP